MYTQRHRICTALQYELSIMTKDTSISQSNIQERSQPLFLRTSELSYNAMSHIMVTYLHIQSSHLVPIQFLIQHYSFLILQNLLFYQLSLLLNFVQDMLHVLCRVLGFLVALSSFVKPVYTAKRKTCKAAKGRHHNESRSRVEHVTGNECFSHAASKGKKENPGLISVLSKLWYFFS